MAITSSGLFIPTWRDLLDASQLAINLNSTANKVALITNAATPDFSTHDSFTDLSANEVSGAGYTAGGQAVVTPVVDESPVGSIRFDLADTVWAAATITNARALVFYADALANDDLICLSNFGGDFSTSNGTFTVQYSALGLFALDITPL